MGDLISRSALLKILKEWADSNAMKGYDTAYDVVQDCISVVETQPTAYDVEKVEAELKEKLPIYTGKAIDIIKRGGVE